MSDKEIQKVSYHCSKLGNIASLLLEYSKKHDFSFLTGFDCENSRECEAGTESPNGSWSFNWDVCPAFNDITKTLKIKKGSSEDGIMS